MSIPIYLASKPETCEAPGELFKKPSLEITGQRTAARLLKPVLSCAAALSWVTAHRGFMRFLSGLSHMRVFDSAHCKAALTKDAFFGFAATDSYWGFYIYLGMLYEASLHHVFAAISDIDYQVLDCGANYGYWSVILSGSAYGKRNVIAIEASAPTFKALQSNCELNGNRFTCINRAVSSRTGQSLLLEHRSHESAHICAEATSCDVQYFEKVHSIDLDDLCKMLRPYPDRLVIKIDIEGHEIEALMGAECIRNRDVLIMFEDHGLDPSSRNTAYLLELGTFALFWVDDDGRCCSVSDIREVKRIKKPRNCGYNFFATTREGEFHRCLRDKLARNAVAANREARTQP